MAKLLNWNSWKLIEKSSNSMAKVNAHKRCQWLPAKSQTHGRTDPLQQCSKFPRSFHWILVNRESLFLDYYDPQYIAILSTSNLLFVWSKCHLAPFVHFFGRTMLSATSSHAFHLTSLNCAEHVGASRHQVGAKQAQSWESSGWSLPLGSCGVAISVSIGDGRMICCTKGAMVDVLGHKLQ